MVLKNIAKRACDVLGIPHYWILSNIEELRMLLVRIYALLPMQRLKVRRLQQGAQLNLLFGCGETSYPGWVGIDCLFRNNVDLLLDLRRPLPFSNCTVDYCYSEHVLEHLFPSEGLNHLREVLRILKPGGVYRVVVPDAARFFQSYLGGNEAFFHLAFPWADRPMQAIWHVVNWGGAHRNVLDFGEIEHMGSEAGFTKVQRSEANGSDIPKLHIDRLQPQRVAESMYLELTKSPTGAA